jgi:stage II sporulation protein D
MARHAWRILAAVVLAACGRSVEPPPVAQMGVRDGREPVVRVHLRSIEPIDGAFTVAGKEGLVVEVDGVATSTAKPVVFRAGPGDGIRMDGKTVERAKWRPLGGLLTVNGSTYAGTLEWHRGRLVNRVTLENYVLGVLRGELPLRDVPKEAAAAQAIAVRSYTMHYLAQDKDGFDVDDTILFQRYVGVHYAPDDDDLRAGVRTTTGLFLLYRGRALKAYYHSTCGGHTTDLPTGLDRASQAPLSGVPCAYCKDTKYWRWSATLPAARVLKAAALEGPLRSVEVVERGPGDRALRLRIRAATGERTMPANEARLAIGPSELRSTRIDSIAAEGDAVQVTGGGWGHGVGLCQMGAIGMAKQGSTGREIVAYYYPGSTVERAY